jgi:hypothetical protein
VALVSTVAKLAAAAEPSVELDVVRIVLSLGDLPRLIADAFCKIVPFC